MIGGQYGTGFLRDQEKIPLRERDRPIRARDHYQNGTIDTFTGLGNYQNGTRNNTNGIDTFTRLTHTGSMLLQDRPRRDRCLYGTDPYGIDAFTGLTHTGPMLIRD